MPNLKINHHSLRYLAYQTGLGYGTTSAAAPATETPLFRAVTTANQAFGTSVTANVPTGTADGDLMLLAVSVNGPGNPTATGWTHIVTVNTQEGANPNRLAIYKRTASSEPASYSITMDSSRNYWANIITWYSNTSQTLDVDVFASDAPADASASLVAPSVTTTVDNAAINCFYTVESSVSGTPDTGFTERWETSGVAANYLMSGEQASAGSTGTKTATNTASYRYGAATVAVIEVV